MYFRSVVYLSSSLLAILFSTIIAQAQQVAPDGSLNTIVNSSNGRDFVITGGGNAGKNLFHSFSEFSVPTGGSALFDNVADVQNIFSRVTGSSVSNIDGLIRANGSANFFLLNPNGVVFGPNAALNIGGSFLGTTASRIKFADGVEFNATSPSSLLTVNVPIGLQFGSTAGPIQVNGTGHTLVSPSGSLTSYIPLGPIGGLQLQPGNTLALVGGEINLVGGILTAPSGRVELGSVGPLQVVGFEVSDPTWKFTYDLVNPLGNISLSQRALVDVSGAPSGSIQVQGRQVSITDGSLLFVQNLGLQTGGDISIRADSLNIIGNTAFGNIRSGIFNETRLGKAGDISVQTRTLSVSDGGELFSQTLGLGPSGNIDINASESVQVTGFVATNPQLFSLLGTVSLSPLPTGSSGTINIVTPTLSLRNGGIISATTLGNAPAGNITVKANQVEVSGTSPDRQLGQSALTSSTLGQGNAGNIFLNTDMLSIKAGGTLNTASSNNGAAGDILINASQSIEVAGYENGFRSDISSSVYAPSPLIQALLGIPPISQGNAGNVMLNTPTLAIYDQGEVKVINDVLGKGGELTVIANQIRLDSQGAIAARTALGQGGNVGLQSQLLLMRGGSTITATAGGAGNGGNISIDSPLIVGLENSDIIADALKGRGGNIAITTQDLLGLKYRQQLTAESDITASSQFGVNGTVQVNTIGVDPNSGLTALPVDIVDPSQKIATGCAGQQTGSFVVTGRGGMPTNPSQWLNAERLWQDLRAGSLPLSNPLPKIVAITPSPLEATAWQRNRQGQTELIATTAIAANPLAITCAK
jgi:filamentous hemagglutinin family protein